MLVHALQPGEIMNVVYERSISAFMPCGAFNITFTLFCSTVCRLQRDGKRVVGITRESHLELQRGQLIYRV